jgi:hypothetical protein
MPIMAADTSNAIDVKCEGMGSDTVQRRVEKSFRRAYRFRKFQPRTATTNGQG